MSELIASNVDLFMYLIEGIRIGTWKAGSTFELGLKRIIWNANFVRGTVPNTQRESNEEIWPLRGFLTASLLLTDLHPDKILLFPRCQECQKCIQIVEIKGAVSRNLSKFKQRELPSNWVNHKNNSSKHYKNIYITFSKYNRRHRWTNLKKIKTDCNCGC